MFDKKEVLTTAEFKLKPEAIAAGVGAFIGFGAYLIYDRHKAAEKLIENNDLIAKQVAEHLAKANVDTIGKNCFDDGVYITLDEIGRLLPVERLDELMSCMTGDESAKWDINAFRDIITDAYAEELVQQVIDFHSSK